MSFYIIFTKVSVIFALIVIGYFFGKKGLVTDKGQKEITTLVLYVFLPCALVRSFNVEFSFEILKTGISLASVMFIVYLAVYILGRFISEKFKTTGKARDVYVLSMVLPNVGFMGYPIIESIFGPSAIIYAVMANMAFEFFSWTFGVKIITRNSDTKDNTNVIKTLFTTPAILSLLIGLIIFMMPFSIPEPFISTINLLGNAMSPVAMIIVGVSLSKTNTSALAKNFYIYITCAIRLFVIPIFVMNILKAIGFSELSYSIATVLISMPTATYANIFSTKYGSDSTLASEIIFVGTIISMVSIPLMLSLL